METRVGNSAENLVENCGAGSVENAVENSVKHLAQGPVESRVAKSEEGGKTKTKMKIANALAHMRARALPMKPWKHHDPIDFHMTFRSLHSHTFYN